MFHSDITRSIMQERVRELRAEGAAARDARAARRARRFWEERVLAGGVVRRAPRARRSPGTPRTALSDC